MPYIIDGHNLIPKIRGMSLSSMDDEIQLVGLLQEFCRLKRQSVEVFFDGALEGQSGTRKIGMIAVHFIRKGKTADEAIIHKLKNMKDRVKNLTVVTSDHHILIEARYLGAKVMASDEFARLLNTPSIVEKGNIKDEQKISDREVDEWLKEFEKGKR